MALNFNVGGESKNVDSVKYYTSENNQEEVLEVKYGEKSVYQAPVPLYPRFYYIHGENNNYTLDQITENAINIGLAKKSSDTHSHASFVGDPNDNINSKVNNPVVFGNYLWVEVFSIPPGYGVVENISDYTSYIPCSIYYRTNLEPCSTTPSSNISFTHVVGSDLWAMEGTIPQIVNYNDYYMPIINSKRGLFLYIEDKETIIDKDMCRDTFLSSANSNVEWSDVDSNAWLKKTGTCVSGLVQVNIIGSSTNPLPSNTTLFTLPEYYRPIQAVTYNIRWEHGSYANHADITIYPNGSVQSNRFSYGQDVSISDYTGINLSFNFETPKDLE